MEIQKTKQVRLTLSQVETITHFYLMSSCDWSKRAREEYKKGNEAKASIQRSIADEEDAQYERFSKIRKELKEANK